MSSSALRTERLVKDYGTFRALDGLDLDVARGEVFGFLGPNGAGKSTTIRILLGLLNPTSGRAELLGRPAGRGNESVRALVGYLPGELSLPADTTAGHHLAYLARLRGGAGTDRIPVLAERFGLDLSTRVRALSKGNKQKVGIVQAFMHRPELLVLDEPTSGLDPLLQHEFLTLATEASAAGATVFMSSHILTEVEEIADRVAIIRDGTLVDTGPVDAFRRRFGQRVTLRFDQPVEAGWFANVPEISDPRIEGPTFSCLLHGEPDRLLKQAAAHRCLRWHAQDRELDEVFLDLYRTAPPAKEPSR